MTSSDVRPFPPTVIMCKRARMLLVIVEMNGSTCPLWAIADLEGYSPTGIDVSRRADFESPEMILHKKGRYEPPYLETRLVAEAVALRNNPSCRREMLARDPVRRLSPAWESKILTPYTPRDIFLNAAPLVKSADGIDISTSFRSFVAILPGTHILNNGRFATHASKFNALPPGELDLPDVAEIRLFGFQWGALVLSRDQLGFPA